MNDTSEQPQFKTCSNPDCPCDNPQLVTEFHKGKDRRDGLCPYCKTCVKEKGRLYRENNPDRVRETRRRWKKNNPDKIRAEKQRYWTTNKERALARNLKWSRKNRAALNARNRKYRQDNLEKVRKQELERRNKDRARYRAIDHRRESRKRSLPASLTSQQWEWLLEQSGHCCVYCGKHESEVGTLQQEHTTPIVQGGAYTVTNIRPACPKCNYRKGGRTPYQAGMTMAIVIDVLGQMKCKGLFDD